MPVYTLFSISETAMGMVEQVERLHMTKSDCIKRAEYLTNELYDGAKCSPESPTDSPNMIRLPSGTVVHVQMKDSIWFYLDQLTGDDKRLMDELTAPEYRK